MAYYHGMVIGAQDMCLRQINGLPQTGSQDTQMGYDLTPQEQYVLMTPPDHLLHPITSTSVNQKRVEDPNTWYSYPCLLARDYPQTDGGEKL